MQRTHEFLLDGDAQSYNRLGVGYVESSDRATLYHPDSQHSEQTVVLWKSEIEQLHQFLGEVLEMMVQGAFTE